MSETRFLYLHFVAFLFLIDNIVSYARITRSRSSKTVTEKYIINKNLFRIIVKNKRFRSKIYQRYW